MTIRVVVADDHTIVREGLCALLQHEEDVEVVDQVADGRKALEAAATAAPHVVVMDLSMPGMNGIEATRRIVHDFPRVRVLCLSMHAERQYVCEVLKAGADGYVLKDGSADELVRAVREVANGRKYVSPAIAGVVLGELAHPSEDGEDVSLGLLTPREREVLQLLAEGRSTKEIALRLGVSAKTVATHREHVMRKIDIDTIAGLTKYAIRHGLTTADRSASD